MAETGGDNREKVHLDPVVGGLTRPPMMLGVPYTYFVLELTFVMLLFVNAKSLLLLLLGVPLHAAGCVFTARDARFIDILLVRFGRCPMTRNRGFWGGTSYMP